MAIITKLSEQKNKKRINVFVDDAFFCGLNKESVVIFGLKVGKEVSEKKLKEACFHSEVKSAFSKASDILGVRMHSKKEIFDKLFNKGYEKDVIEATIHKLEDYGFIDDRIFAKEFVQGNTKNSKKVKEQKLKQKGVSDDIIKEVLADYDEIVELELCVVHAEKCAKNKNLSKKEDVQKIYVSLMRKGFSYDIAKKAIQKLAKEIEFEEF